jgi:prophage antirepressor-like protein
MTFPIQGLNTFHFTKRLMRTVIDPNGDPWWVAKDVLTSLEFSEASLTNVAKMVAHVPEDWKGRYRIPTPSGDQEMITLSEQGLYFFLGRSDKPAALPMQRWVAGEVLPAIRQTGNFCFEPRFLTVNDISLAQAQMTTKRDLQFEKLFQQQAAMSAQLDEISRLVRPTAYSQRDMKLDKEHVWFDDMARLLGTGPKRLYKFLREHGILIKDFTGRNRPVKTYVDEGYIGLLLGNYIYFTVKGRMWMHHNANLGWLDSILDREALLSRLSTTVNQGLPQPVLGCAPTPR